MKYDTVKSTFTTGVIDPVLHGRKDTQLYQNGIEIGDNAIVLSSGGVTRTPGTRFVSDSGVGITSRLFGIRLLRTDLSPQKLQGYLIEFRSDNTIRFYTNNAIIEDGGSPYEIVSPFTDADLSKINPEFYDNALYLFHEDFQTQVLTRTDDTDWTIAGAAFKFSADYTATITRTGTTAKADVSGDALPYCFNIDNGDKYVEVSGADQAEYNGTFPITKSVDNTSSFYIEYTVSGSPATPATGTITIKAAVFNSTLGWPKCGAFIQQRMAIADNKSVLFSRSGFVLDFTPGTDDDDGFTYTLMDAESPVMQIVKGDKKLSVHTDSEVIFIQGASGKPITPSTPDISVKAKKGCMETVRPLSFGGEVMFVTSYGKKVRSLEYELTTDSFMARDKGFLAGHLFDMGIKEMFQTSEPDPIIWLITNDGYLISLVYDKEKEVLAYSRRITDGVIKSGGAVRTDTCDQVWLSIERTISGSTKNYIEYFNLKYHNYENTDSAVVASDVAGKKVWDGFDHLEGETIDILADNIPQPQQVVSGGEITLTDVAYNVEGGLHYETYIKDLPLEAMTEVGSIQGRAVSLDKIIVQLYKSIGCTLNGEQIPFREFGDGVLDTAIEPFTGEKRVPAGGWDNKGVVEIKQTQPLPLTVLAIIKGVNING